MNLKYFFFLAALISSCNSPIPNYKPKSSGNINTVTVVIENSLWNSSTGDSIRSFFASEFEGLPQQEPIFSLRQIPTETFSGFTRESRNIILIQKITKNTFVIEKDKYAYPQILVNVSAPTVEQIINKIKKNKERIIDEIKTNEIKEKQKRIKISKLNKTNLSSALSIDLVMPSAYKVYKKGDGNIVWLQRDTDKGTVNILAYELKSEERFEALNLEKIIQIRDSIGELFVPGRNENSYMITEFAYEPYIKKTKVKGLEAIETRGTWEVKNDFMAGPFVNYVIKDTLNKRMIVLEGFVFSPSSKKRNLIFELEAIFKSLKIYKRN